MKKLLAIIFLGLLLSGNAHAKVKTLEKNENYIILKYSSLLKLKEKKQRKLLYKTMMVAANHCNSVGKNAYWFLGFTRGESEITRGTYTYVECSFRSPRKLHSEGVFLEAQAGVVKSVRCVVVPGVGHRRCVAVHWR